MKTSETKLVGRLLAFLVAGVLGIVWAAPNAEAIPAFARRENMACTNCHTAWPRLNAFGRRYKENGYQVMRGQPSDHMDISKKLSLPKTVPFSAVINSRPYDKKKNGPAKLRALHEAEFFLGGNFMGWGSVFAEAELEDEKDFTFELAHAVGGLHFNQYINVLAGKASAFHMDPYDTLSNRHFSRSRHLIGDSEVLFGAAGPLAPAHETQTVQVYGRAGGLFYGAGLSADGVEGDGTDDYTARLAYDVMKKELTVGSFLFDGSTKDAGQKHEFREWGVDVQGQCGMFNYDAGYANTSYRMPSATYSDNNDVYFGEAFLTWRAPAFDDLPIPLTQVVPLARFQKWEENDGEDDRADMVLNLTAYWTENLSSSFEYYQTLDGPDNRRFTLYFVFGV